MRSNATVLVVLLSTVAALLAAGSPSDALVLGPVVGPDWATVTAIVNPQDATAGCEFEYGTTSAYGSTVPCGPQPSGTSPAAVSARITGLTPSTTYHYRVVITGQSGSASGPDGIFTTLPPPPVVTTTTAVASNARPVTLNGTVNPNGSAVTDCHFEYGLTSAYSGQAPCDQAPGSGTAAVPVSATVPWTGFPLHYRLVATTASGTSFGEDAIALVIIADGPEMFGTPRPKPGTVRITTIGRPHRGAIALRVACDGAPLDFCRGTLTLAARVRLHGRRRVVVLGSAPYDLAAGQRRATVAVRLSLRARRLLRLRARPRIAAHAIPAARAP